MEDPVCWCKGFLTNKKGFYEIYQQYWHDTFSNLFDSCRNWRIWSGNPLYSFGHISDCCRYIYSYWKIRYKFVLTRGVIRNAGTLPAFLQNLELMFVKIRVDGIMVNLTNQPATR